jgi:hypothetical protein
MENNIKQESNWKDISEVDNYDYLCNQTIYNTTGLLFHIKYNDPHVEYPNPNINKNKPVRKTDIKQYNY